MHKIKKGHGFYIRILEFYFQLATVQLSFYCIGKCFHLFEDFRVLKIRQNSKQNDFDSFVQIGKEFGRVSFWEVVNIPGKLQKN